MEEANQSTPIEPAAPASPEGSPQPFEPGDPIPGTGYHYRARPDQSAPVEGPEPNVYGDPSGRGYSDPVRALQGELQSQAREAARTQAEAKADQPQRYGRFTVPDLRPQNSPSEDAVREADASPPSGLRFGLSEERKLQLAEELKARKGAAAQVESAYDFDFAFRSVMADPGGYEDFIRNVPAEHQPGLEGFVASVIAHHPENVIGELIGLGYLPAEALPQDPRVSPDDPSLDELPPLLRDVPLALTPEEWDEISLLAPEVRDGVLAAIGHYRNAQQADEARREAEDRQFVEDVQAAGVELVNYLHNMHTDKHLKSFKDFSPYANQYENENARDVLMHAAEREMGMDDRFEKMREDALRLAREIPWLNAQGRREEADAAWAELNEWCDVWNEEFGRCLKFYRDEFSALARDAMLWREYQKSSKKESGEKEAATARGDMSEFDLSRPIGNTRFFHRKRK